jgi:PII-like signaling protein
VTGERLELTVYFGERARADGGFLADAVAAIFARHELHLSVVLRGMAGFGAAQRLQTDRLLSLSEDLPVVTVAVDASDRIEAALRDVEALEFHGLATTERDVAAPGQDAKLTVYARRGEHRGVVATLHRHGVAGATALLGVDGTVRGARRRARLVGDNRDVPVMVVSVGETDRIHAAMAELRGVESTLEHVRICRRDGAALAALPEAGGAGWQKVSVYTSEATGQHDDLVERLRRRGAAGATVLRGVWGYHGDHQPHGDRLLQLRRRVPVVTIMIDTPEQVARWAPVVEDVTATTGLVTSEVVPVYSEWAGGVRSARANPPNQSTS